MNYSRMLAAVPVLLGLAACDEKAATTTSTAQQAPTFSQVHPATDIQLLQSRLLEHPDDFDTLSRLGDLYFESGQYLPAIQIYDRAVTVNPQCADCLNDKGLAQFYVGDTEGALASLGLANEIAPDYPNAWLSKGYILLSVGRDQEAIEPLRQVQAVDATGVLAAEARKFLESIEEKQPQD